MIWVQGLTTYFFFVHAHKPVAHIKQVVDSMVCVFSEVWRVRKVDARNSFVLPALAKRGLVVQQTELLDDVVHDKIDVDLRFAAHALLVGFAKLTNLTDVKSLVGIQLEHSHDDAAELRRIFLA